MEGSQTVSKQETTGLAAIEPTRELMAQLYDAIIDGELPPEVGDPEITRKAIQRRIAAGGLDASMDPAQSLPSLRDEATVPLPTGKGKMTPPLRIFGVHFNPSTIENDNGEKRGLYAVVDVLNTETGERDTYSCGGGNVLVQLAKALEERRYPLDAVLEVIPTGTAGRSTMWLRRPTAGEESTAKSK